MKCWEYLNQSAVATKNNIKPHAQYTSKCLPVIAYSKCSTDVQKSTDTCSSDPPDAKSSPVRENATVVAGP